MAKEIIVIGSGAAGITAASSARATDATARITVFTEDQDIAYSPCVIPWVLEGKLTWNEMSCTPLTSTRKRRISK